MNFIKNEIVMGGVTIDLDFKILKRSYAKSKYTTI